MDNIFLSILFGYLIGSISLGYFFGRVFKKIDIRQYGIGNTGATNTFRVVGKGPGIITGSFDFLKGILVILALQSFFAISEPIAYLSGIAAILGHIFPFYLKFRGGMGTATASGLLVFFLIKTLQNNWISWPVLFIPLISIFLFLFIVRRKATHISAIPGIISLSSLLTFVYLSAPLNALTLFVGFVGGFLFFQNIFYLSKDQKFLNVLEEAKNIKDIVSWRTYLRPLAVIFPLLYFYFDKNLVLISTGIIAFILVAIDLFRLRIGKLNAALLRKFFIKEKETRALSSMTFFMLALFIAFLVFPRDIAIIAAIFLIFGDLFAKFFHPLYGETSFFQKTLEGAAAFLGAALIFSFPFAYFLGFPFLILLVGAVVAAITESLPLGINDNFIIALISGATMYLMIVF